MGHPVVPPVPLGEGEGLADEAPDALAQGVVPAFHVRSFPGLLAGTAVTPLREDRRMGLPEVTEAAALAAGFRHPLPRNPAGAPAVVAVGEGPDLAGPVAHHRPESALAPAPPHERPRLVESGHITGPSREQSLLDGGQARSFF